jgi:DNA-binding NarL/FixJ family response regulator
MTSKIKLGILEDVNVIRSTLKDFFEDDPFFEVIVSACNAEELLENEDKHLLDQLLCDINLPGKSGIELTWILKNKHPDVQIIMFTVYEDDDKIFDAIRSGADGYLLKGSSLIDLRKALLDVRNGGSAMSPAIARRVIDFFRPKATVYTSGIESLTDQEKQIVRLILEGKNNRLIADNMCISVDTIKYHIKKIYRKLQINSREDLERNLPRDLFNI